MKQITGALRSLRSGEGLKGQLMRGGVGSVAVKIASILANLAAAIVLARLLGPEQFGVYSFVIAVITLLTIPAQFGLPNLVVRETAKAQANEDWAKMKGIWRWSNIVALGFSAVLITAAAVAITIFDRGPKGQMATAFLYALPLIPLLALGNLRGAALRGLRKVVQGLLPEQVLRHLFLIALVVFVWLPFIASSDAATAITLHVVAAAAAYGIGALIFFRHRPGEVESVARSYETRAWLTSTIPLALYAGMNQITKQTDIVMLGFLANPEDIGYYRVAVQGASLVAFGQAAANMVVAPYFARFYSQNDIARMQQLATRSARLVTLISLVPFIAFVFFGQEIVMLLFGAKYTDAALPLAILATGQLIHALVTSVGVLLSMTGNEREMARVLVLVAALNIVLNLSLIPVWGLAGAAVSTASSLAIQNIALWKILLNRTGVNATAFG